MPFDGELQFLCEILRKSHVRFFTATKNDFIEKILEKSADTFIDSYAFSKEDMPLLWSNLEARTVYQKEDSFQRCYRYFLLPPPRQNTLLLVGPFLKTPISQQRILELGEEKGISPQSLRYLEEYYRGLPVLAEGSSLLLIIDTFCERIWHSPSFAIVDVDQKDLIPASLIDSSMSASALDDVLINMKALEKRYAFENELMQAVSHGQLHKENQLLSAFSAKEFEKRTSDPLRNAKNYGIIMNTLLRKAAENGGVHPVYLDRLSSEFAAKIEQLPSLEENTSLMCDMFRGYCRLVRKHSIKQYSPAVQKAILMIDSDLSADLSPNLLAERQSISLGYLSTIFKKETGKTVSEYIREKRIKHAAHLLRTTHLQIQTIALHCGIMDVQYFSKIFKKQTGKTPKEYRESGE